MKIACVVLLCLVGIACVDSFCWGATDSTGHCTGLGTSKGDIGYEPMGFWNTVGYGVGHRQPVREYAPPKFATYDPYGYKNAYAYGYDHKRRYGL